MGKVKRSIVETGLLHHLTGLKVKAVETLKWILMSTDLNRFGKLWDSLIEMVKTHVRS